MLKRKAEENTTILRDLKRALVKIELSQFTSASQPDKLARIHEESLSESQRALRKLWRIRRCLRDVNGLPLYPPRKELNITYDPERDSPVAAYDPTNPEAYRGMYSRSRSRSRSPSLIRSPSPEPSPSPRRSPSLPKGTPKSPTCSRSPPRD